MHINVTATTKALALKAAKEQLAREVPDKALADYLYDYMSSKVAELENPGNGLVVEISADINIDAAAYLRIA